MKVFRKKSFVILVLSLVFAVCSLFITACDCSSGAEYKIEVSGAKISFDVGESFSTGNIVVKITRGSESRIAEEGEYQIDSSGFDNSTDGVYVIKVIVEGVGETEYEVMVGDGIFTDYLELA